MIQKNGALPRSDWVVPDLNFVNAHMTDARVCEITSQCLRHSLTNLYVKDFRSSLLQDQQSRSRTWPREASQASITYVCSGWSIVVCGRARGWRDQIISTNEFAVASTLDPRSNEGSAAGSLAVLSTTWNSMTELLVPHITASIAIYSVYSSAGRSEPLIVPDRNLTKSSKSG